MYNENKLTKLEEKVTKSEEIIQYLSEKSLKPDIINPLLESIESQPVDQAYRANQILTRPHFTLNKLEELEDIKDFLAPYSTEIKEQAEIQIKYKGYIDKEKTNVDKLKKLESIKISPDLIFNDIKSLSSEAKQKLTKVKPSTIAQASRISGVSPSDINVLLIYLGV